MVVHQIHNIDLWGEGRRLLMMLRCKFKGYSLEANCRGPLVCKFPKFTTQVRLLTPWDAVSILTI